MRHTLQRANIFGGGGGGGGGPSLHYILDDEHKPVPCDDLLTWAHWLEAEHRKPVGVSKAQVGFAKLPGYGYVSTVFMGTDHNWSGVGGKLILFETMAFFKPGGGRGRNDIQLRASTWTQAVDMHRRAVAALRRHGKELFRLHHAGDVRRRERLRFEILTSIFDSLSVP